jgi:hypothetical protein
MQNRTHPPTRFGFAAMALAFAAMAVITAQTALEAHALDSLLSQAWCGGQTHPAFAGSVMFGHCAACWAALAFVGLTLATAVAAAKPIRALQPA